ncbi:alpha/beta hydrolase [Rhodococcus sp. O3]|uniref:alpha/beta hydrolase n=1 Tax=Rhodococcus sp. O3 TaxID=3404919 RepID=UPI003B68189A
MEPKVPAGVGHAEADRSGTEVDDGESTPTESRRRLLYVTLPGCWGALVFACLSFTPSLLPRGGLLQGLVCGITAAIGYGLGVLAAWVWRAFADRGPRRPSRRAWLVFAVTAVVLFAVAFGFGQYWQHRIRELMGVTEYNIPLAVLSPVIAVLVFALLVAMGRGIRGIYRWTAKLLDRWIGRSAASAVGWVLVAVLVYLVVSGLLLGGLVDVANSAFSLRDTQTPEGVQQPTTGLRSGGPESVVPWDTLGYQGRAFIGDGPSTDEIGRFAGGPAQEPIRVYAGLASADDSEARAALAVEDLVRAGGFERANLLVVTTTGSGWVDPALVDSFEYLTGGDAATVAIQYSYLPSWISYLVDQSKAREAGRDLFDAVYEEWLKLPPDSRPRLFVAGESLGSFGGETAFSGEHDLSNRTAGTLFAGPPNFNTLFREFSDRREPGSPEAEPIYRNGRTVRFTNDPESGIPPEAQPWDGNRVLYLMHPSDPIVWWSPHLILNEPDWIGEAPGTDVLEDMVWIPFVTFWQVTADLPFSTGVPGGHGHKYTTEYVDGWNAVLQPESTTAEDLATLRAVVDSEE